MRQQVWFNPSKLAPLTHAPPQRPTTKKIAESWYGGFHSKGGGTSIVPASHALGCDLVRQNAAPSARSQRRRIVPKHQPLLHSQLAPKTNLLPPRPDDPHLRPAYFTDWTTAPCLLRLLCPSCTWTNTTYDLLILALGPDATLSRLRDSHHHAQKVPQKGRISLK